MFTPKTTSPLHLTLSFFFLSGVMNPFLAFLPAAWASSLALTSAFFLSISACFLRKRLRMGWSEDQELTHHHPWWSLLVLSKQNVFS